MTLKRLPLKSILTRICLRECIWPNSSGGATGQRAFFKNQFFKNTNKMNFIHRKNAAMAGQHLIANEKICLRFFEADFDSDEEMNEAIEFILAKLNS